MDCTILILLVLVARVDEICASFTVHLQCISLLKSCEYLYFYGGWAVLETLEYLIDWFIHSLLDFKKIGVNFQVRRRTCESVVTYYYYLYWNHNLNFVSHMDILGFFMISIIVLMTLMTLMICSGALWFSWRKLVIGWTSRNL